MSEQGLPGLGQKCTVFCYSATPGLRAAALGVGHERADASHQLEKASFTGSPAPFAMSRVGRRTPRRACRVNVPRSGAIRPPGEAGG